jgi:hypothetical protein
VYVQARKDKCRLETQPPCQCLPLNAAERMLYSLLRNHGPRAAHSCGDRGAAFLLLLKGQRQAAAARAGLLLLACNPLPNVILPLRTAARRHPVRARAWPATAPGPPPRLARRRAHTAPVRRCCSSSVLMETST